MKILWKAKGDSVCLRKHSLGELGPGTGSFLKYDISNFTPNLSVRVADPNLTILVSSFVTQLAQTYFVCPQNIPFLYFSDIRDLQSSLLIGTFYEHSILGTFQTEFLRFWHENSFMLLLNVLKMFLECSAGIFTLDKMAPLMFYADFHLFSFQKRTVSVKANIIMWWFVCCIQ